MKEIETPRILLRLFKPEDLDELAQFFSDPEVMRHVGDGRPTTRAEARSALHTIIRHCERHGYGRWAAVLKSTGRLIGYGGLRTFEGRPELVYLLSRPHWGHGLATEIAEASLEYGFLEFEFEEIIAMAKTANTASRRVMEKIGMSFERNAIVSGIEVVRYSLSREDYLARTLLYECGEYVPGPDLAAEQLVLCL